MRYLIRVSILITAMATAVVGGPAVLAYAEDSGDGGHHAVFVQTNDATGNSIAAYSRNGDGTLTYIASYPTGGNGVSAPGSVDPLASQSSLVYDREHRLLLGVNAGSDTVSVFSVSGAKLHLRQVVASGGPFPASIAVHDDIAYVLDAGGAGYVQGYRIDDGRLHPIAGSLRSLGLASTNSPSQVGFSPDGRHLVITKKNNGGGSVDVFKVSEGGLLSNAPTATAVGGNAFAFVFDSEGRLVIVNAASANLSTFTVNGNGSLSPISAGANDGQTAACWVTAVGRNFYAANAGSGDLSQYTISEDGTVTLRNAQAATGIPGSVDMAASGHFLYAQSGGSGSVKGFSVSEDGSLSPIGSWTIPGGASQEGIAAA